MRDLGMEEMDGKLKGRLEGYGLNEISPPQVFVQELKIPAGCEASGKQWETEAVNNGAFGDM